MKNGKEADRHVGGCERLISERFAIKICRVVIFTGICYDKNQ